MTLARLLLGRRLANRESAERKIGALEAVPAMGLDGLGSSSYGPEAALTTLLPLGVAGLSLIGPIIGVIIALLAILYLSYRQTIRAYPNNGGAYIVARENLGRWAALLAAAALMVDYVLNVAVGISAGVAALTSAVPDLHSHTLPLCLGVLALITLSNLRGTLDAGRLFALPTYLFVASFLALLTIGLYRINAGDVAPVVAPPALPNTGTEIGQAAGLWLILHAFASGCAVLGVPPSQVTFLDLPDSQAPSEGPAFEAAARQIVAVGRRIAPTAIFATWRWEPHGDHQATWHLADRVGESLECGVYGYLIWAWQLPPDSDLPEPAPSGWRLDVRAHQAVKRAAIACHRSQTTGLIDDAETCFQLADEMIAELTGPYECFVRGGSRPPDF